MDSQRQEKLTAARRFLVADLSSLNLIFEHLISKNELTVDQSETIKAHTDRTDNVTELLNIIHRRGNSAYDAFREALVETKQPQHLINLLPDSSGNQEAPVMSVAPGKAVKIAWIQGHSLRHNKQIMNEVFDNSRIRGMPVVVISVMGKTGTGKSRYLSSLLSYLLNGKGELSGGILKGGFKWTHSAESCTDGIWTWSEPIVVTTQSGREAAMLLFDVEGSFGVGTAWKDNAKIFGVIMAMSSVIIYNIKDKIFQDDLTNIKFFMDAGEEAMQLTERKPIIRQRLIPVIRDWDYLGEKSYGWGGGNEYWIGVLAKSDPKDLAEYFSGKFTSVSCILLPKPGDRIKDTWPNCSLEHLALGFRKETDNIHGNIRGNLEGDIAVSKGSELNPGEILTYILAGWIEMCSMIDQLGLKNTYDSFKERKREEARSAFTMAYDSKMQKNFDNEKYLKESDFQNAHEAALGEAKKSIGQFSKVISKKDEQVFAGNVDENRWRMQNARNEEMSHLKRAGDFQVVSGIVFGISFVGEVAMLTLPPLLAAAAASELAIILGVSVPALAAAPPIALAIIGGFCVGSLVLGALATLYKCNKKFRALVEGAFDTFGDPHLVAKWKEVIHDLFARLKKDSRYVLKMMATLP